MGIAYRIDQERGIIYVVYDRLVTDDDFVAHTNRLMVDPAWPPRLRLHLTDISTQTDPHRMTKSVIRRMAEMWGTQAEQMRGMRIAVVANEAFDNALAFEQSISRYGPNLIVFNLLPTACAWLGIDVDVAEQTLQAIRAEMREASRP